MALLASVNIDGQTPITTHEDMDRIGQRVIPAVTVDGLLITFSAFAGNEAVCRNLDRLIGALTELRANADARLLEDIVVDLEASTAKASA